MSPKLAGQLLQWSECPDVRKKMSLVYLVVAVTVWITLGWYLVKLQANHTAQKKLTEILVQSLNDSQTAVLAVDPQQTITLANPVAVKFFGKDPAGCNLGKLWPEHLRDDFTDIYSQSLQAATEAGAPTVRLDGSLMGKDGHPEPVYLVLRPVMHGSETAMVVTVIPMNKESIIRVESNHDRAQRTSPRNIFEDSRQKAIGE